MLKDVLKIVDDTFVHTGEVLEMYIPEKFFDTGIAAFSGSKLELTLGVFPVRGLKNDKVIFKETLNIPSKFYITPSALKKTDADLFGNGEMIKYRVAVFFKDSPVMPIYLERNSTNSETFLNMMLLGKIEGVPYSKLLDIWFKNLDINKVGLNVPASVMEMIITQIYRYKGNSDLTFADAKNKNPNISDFDYVTVNIRDICSKSSVFASLSFEDFDRMIAASLNMSKSDKPQKISPLEKVIKY